MGKGEEKPLFQIRAIESSLWSYLFLHHLEVIIEELPIQLLQELVFSREKFDIYDWLFSLRWHDRGRQWLFKCVQRSEELDLSKAFKHLMKIRDAFIMKNMGLIYKVIRRYKGREQEDLVQNGVLGLIRAVENFDIEKGFCFSTYAMGWINHSVNRYMDNNFSLIRVPIHMKDKERNVRNFIQKFEEYSGHGPSYADLINKFGEKLIFEIFNVFYTENVSSLDSEISDEDGSSSFHSVLGDPKALEHYATFETDEVISKSLESLSHDGHKRYREIIERRLDGETLDEVGYKIGVCRERIRQLEVKALSKVRQCLFSRKKDNASLLGYTEH